MLEPLTPISTSAISSNSSDLLAGTWRLIYSSGFNSGAVGRISAHPNQ